MKRLFSFFRASVLLLAFALVFITCAKEYSYEGGGQLTTAVYTLSGAGGDCTGSILSGKYYAGKALTSVNTVQLAVNVTTVGTYNLNTNFADGFSFSGIGTFSDTGTQTITLTGGGVPTAAGNIVFTPPVGLGCSFGVQVDTARPPSGAFTLLGEPDNCTNAVVYGTYTLGTRLTASNIVLLSVNVTETGPYSIKTDTLDGISFSAMGSFTKTGIQNVTLFGSGAPNAPRNLHFTPFTPASHCTFNVTVANPQPEATYVLESGFGSPNPCIYTVGGTYTANTVLNNTNNVSARVYVTNPGNFTIETNSVNGMMFSFTGTFTTTGIQYVILKGSGVPAAAGTYTFIPEIVGAHPLGGGSCAFQIAVQ